MTKNFKCPKKDFCANFTGIFMIFWHRLSDTDQLPTHVIRETPGGEKVYDFMPNISVENYKNVSNYSAYHGTKNIFWKYTVSILYKNMFYWISIVKLSTFN